MTAAHDALDAILGDPLSAVRAGGFGYVGFDVPQDLVFATGLPCVHLPWHVDRPTPFADRFLESSFPGWARSIVERWSTGEFDGLRAVVFSRGDDASQRLYYYVRELQRSGRLGGPEALVMDVARIPRESSRRHTREALAILASSLEVDEAAWRRGIARANALRDVFADLALRRGADGAAAHRFARASLFADLTTLGAPVGAQGVGARVLLAGSAPPDERLHQAVQRAGGAIVAETHGYGLARLGAKLDAGAADPVAAVAANLLAASGPRSFDDPAEMLSTAFGTSGADAVILWLTREDEALAWHVPAIRRRFAERGVPRLELVARRWDGADGALVEIESFVRSLHS
jgi:hypothetical protein